MYACLQIAHANILKNNYAPDERTEIVHTSEDFDWVCATIVRADGGDNYSQHMHYYSKKTQYSVDEPQKEKLNKLDLQLDQVAESLV